MGFATFATYRGKKLLEFYKLILYKTFSILGKRHVSMTLCEMLWGNFYNINKFNGGYKIKQILTSLIRTYQHIAPKSLRESCRFEPSCSNYMILAIEKHGSVKGVLMGIQRLSKCRYPNGGIDYP